MTPPPEQYVIEARPRALPGMVTLRLGGIPIVRLLVPMADTIAGLAAIFATAALWSPPLAGPALLLIVSLLVGSRSWDRREVNIGALNDTTELGRQVLIGYAAAIATITMRSTGGEKATLYAAGLLFASLFLGRTGARAAQRALARAGRRTRTIVVGTGVAATQLIEAINEEADYGLEVVGAVGAPSSQTRAGLGTRLLGRVADLDQFVASRHAQTVVVASDDADDPGTVAAVRRLLQSDVEVWVVPRFFAIGSVADTHHIGGIPVVRLRPVTKARPGWALKRAFDLVIAGLGLLVSAPVMATIALLIKLDSKGPILFRQERVGLDGEPIFILKFRTMKPTSLLHEQTEWEPDTTRITRVGRWLRSTSLDELPQLLNVLRGELTLVGPRPERPLFVKMFDEMYPGYSDRHRVPAGITGWAQIHGLRGDTSIEARARFDNHYIESWTFGRDLKVLLLTARTLLKRYRPPAPDATTAETDQESEKRDFANAG